MNIFTIALNYLKAKPATTIFNIILLSIGVALMTSILLFNKQIDDRMHQDGKNIDLVIGAKGSPLQLILSTIYHADIPTGNIPLTEFNKIKINKSIKSAIPISLGDSYRSFRIVGTTHNYIKNFNAKLANGRLWNKSMEAVIGSEVTQKEKLKLGINFVGNHGLIGDGHVHDRHKYTIVGTLKPTGTILDRLILTSLESVWVVHDQEITEHNHGHEEEKHVNKGSQIADNKILKKLDNINKEITAILVKYKTRIAAMSLPRAINRNANMQAASPAQEIARLSSLLGIGSDSILMFSVFLVIVALIGVFINLLNNVRLRKYDLAIFRTLGAPKRKILSVVIIEGMIIAVLGCIIGLIIGYGLLMYVINYGFASNSFSLNNIYLIPELYLMLFIVLLSSLLACVIPAWEAYKTDIRSTLLNA